MLATGSEWMPTHTSRPLKPTASRTDQVSSKMLLVPQRLLSVQSQSGSPRLDGLQAVQLPIKPFQALPKPRHTGMLLDALSFGTTNTWWYTLTDNDAVQTNPSFGIVPGNPLSTTPYYDLSCSGVSSSSSAGSGSTASSTASTASSVNSQSVSSVQSVATNSVLATSGGGLSPSGGAGNGIGSVSGVGAAPTGTGTGSSGSSGNSTSTLKTTGKPTGTATSSAVTTATNNAANHLAGSIVGAIGALAVAVAAL